MNLVICYPHYLFFGEGYGFPTGATGFSANNVVTGSRQLRFKSSGAIANAGWATDIDALPSIERTPDFLYIAGLKQSLHSGPDVNIRLLGATDDAFTTSTVTAVSDNAVTDSDLVGRLGDDYFAETSGATAKQYWRARIQSASTTFTHQCRKVMFGQWWYPGVEPDAPARLNFLPGDRLNRRKLALRWRGVSNANLNLFLERILAHASYSPVVLYTRDWHGLLNGERVFHCEVSNFQHRRSIHGLNDISCDFIEVI